VRSSAPGESALLLLDVIERLVEDGIDYAVIGAIAASVHGVVRASVDADALVSVSPQKLKSLASAFASIGLQTEIREGDLDDPIPALLAISDSHGNRVDLLGGLRGLEPAAFSRALVVPFEGSSMRVIGREDFIAMKLFAGGPQDISDARNALLLAAHSFDMNLLRNLAQRYGRDVAMALERLIEDSRFATSGQQTS
jgi:predicted nucleotidyltransferase